MLNDSTRELSTKDRIFAFLVDYKRQYDGNSPVAREIAQACGISISTVNYHLTRLELEDRIRLVGRGQIEIVGGVWKLKD